MTKEEAKQEIDKHYVTSVSTEDVKLIRAEVAHRVIDEIFDYFESKTCDRITEWEQVIDKQQTKTVWFWKIGIDNGTWLITEYAYTEEEIKNKYPHAEIKRMDILGSEEVVL